MRIRSLIQEKFRDLFVDIDLLLTPVADGSGIESHCPAGCGSARERAAAKIARVEPLIPAGNLCGLPAISLPCGFADQMPVALSLVSRPFNENQLIGLGSLFQKQTDWHRKHPPV